MKNLRRSAASLSRKDVRVSDPPKAPRQLEPFSARAFPWHTGFLVLVGLLGLFKMVNADIWWHLRTGELILKSGTIPATDWYTYTNPEAPWIDLHWLFQLVAWAVYSIGGAAGLVLVKCIVGMLAFLACLSIRKRNWDPAIDVLCWIVPVFIFAGRFLVRPEVVTIAFLATTLLILHSAERRPRLLWFLPVVQLAWVNTQSLFVLQWVIIGCYCLDALARSYRNGKSTLPVSSRRFAGILGVTAIATFCNPYGARGVFFPFVIFQKLRGPDREFFHSFASELRGPLDLVNDFGLYRVLVQPTTILLLLLLIAAGTVTVVRWKRGDWEIFRTLLLLGFAYLALKMTRNSALFAVVAGYVLRWNLGVVMERPVARLVHRFPRLIRSVSLATLVLAVLLVSSGAYHNRMRVVPPREFGIGESSWYPHEAARALLEPGMPKRVFAHHLGVAAVCIKSAGPEKTVFVDARLETNTKETLADYKEIIDGLGMQSELALRRLAGDPDPAKWPAVVIANHELASRPGLLGFLAGHPEWVCVFSQPPAGLDIGAPERSFIGGASVFVARRRQEREGIPGADPRWLFVVARNRAQGM